MCLSILQIVVLIDTKYYLYLYVYVYELISIEVVIMVLYWDFFCLKQNIFKNVHGYENDFKRNEIIVHFETIKVVLISSFQKK